LAVTPDIMTTAKALGNGMPIGAMLTTKDIAAALVPGSHASTFGGNPVTSAAAVATMKVMLEDGFFAGVRDRGIYFRDELQKLVPQFPKLLREVRGLGMIWALVLTEEGVKLGPELVNKMLEKGYLINFAGNVALRFVPPLIVTTEEIDRLVAALTQVFAE